MDLIIGTEAARWFQRELGLVPGDAVRFYVRYGGHSTVHPGFSLGVCVESQSKTFTKEAGPHTEVEGVYFHVHESDLWYFNGGNLLVRYIPEDDDVAYDILPADKTAGAE